jgi:polysaccharide pyruvyl transferase CsaB
MSERHVLLLGAYGQHNLGDDALLEIFLRQLRHAPVVVNSASPQATAARFGVRAIATYGHGKESAQLRALTDAGAVVFGGGSLLKEIEGGVVARLRYLVRILGLIALCRLAGRPSAMLGVGMGPLQRPLYRGLARLAANQADLICVRDNDSADLLRAIGVTRPVHVTADPVFLLAAPPAPAKRTRRVVVIPRYSLSAAERDQLAASCDHMIATYEVQVLLMPFQTGYLAQYDDLAAARAIHQRMAQHQHARICTPGSPREALALISGAELVLSARLHGLIFAALCGVPPIGIDYEVKMRSFLKEVGQPMASLSLPDLAGGGLPKLIDARWGQRDTAIQALTAHIQSLRVAARQNFALFQELQARHAA